MARRLHSRLRNLTPRKLVIRLVNFVCYIFYTRSLRFALHELRKTSSTGYDTLWHLFSGFCQKQVDTFVDVGCACGRVVSFLARSYPTCQLNGIERDPVSSEFARQTLRTMPNTTIRTGDIADTLPLNARYFFIYHRSMANF